MEKRIGILGVKFAPTKTGKDKWIIETNDGNFSAWESKIAEELNSKLNEMVSVDIRPPQEGTNYLPTITKILDGAKGNIPLAVAVEDSKDGFVKAGVGVLKETQQGVRSLNGQEQRPLMNQERDDGMPLPSTIGNGDVRGNVQEERTTSKGLRFVNQNTSIIAQCLVKAVIGSGGIETHTIEEAVNMYKEALELLE